MNISQKVLSKMLDGGHFFFKICTLPGFLGSDFNGSEVINVPHTRVIDGSNLNCTFLLSKHLTTLLICSLLYCWITLSYFQLDK